MNWRAGKFSCGAGSPWLGVFIAWAIGLCCLNSVQGQSGYLPQQDDLIVEFREWPVEPTGGYIPLMLSLTNRGPDCEVVVRYREQFAPHQQVSKTVQMPQNAQLPVQLLVPVFDSRHYGELTFYRDGKYLDRLSMPAGAGGYSAPSYSGSHYYSQTRSPPHLVEISTAVPDVSGLTEFLSRHSYSTLSARPQIDPRDAPTNWLGYSSLDIVTVDLRVLDGLAADQRRALQDWVRCGGSLIVHSVGSDEDAKRRVDEALQFDAIAQSSSWQRYDPLQESVELPAWLTPVFLERSPSTPEWELRFVALGRILLLERSPYKLNSRYWSDIFNALGGRERLGWSDRIGAAPTSYCDDFMEFLVPGIRRIPAWGFIGLVSVFGLLIGPVGLFVLSRMNRQSHMLWVVPSVAVLTCLILFCYSTLANGFGTKIRLRSLTILDQTSQSAVATTRMAMFSPTYPGDLRFQSSTAVIPLWPTDSQIAGCQVDWTESQEIRGGVQRANTQTQMLLLQPRTERGRLEMGAVNAGRLPVTNGFSWGLEHLLVRAADGQYYACAQLEPGARAELSPASEEELKSVAEQLKRQKLDAPLVDLMSENYSNRYSGYYSERAGNPATVRTGQAERYHRRLERLGSEAVLPPQSFVALVDQVPSLDLGLTQYSIRDQLHVLVGFY